MKALRFELRRLARGWASVRARGHGARAHALLLVAAVLLAFVHRALVPMPFLSWLGERWLYVAAVALGLYLLGPLLVRLLARLWRPGPHKLARQLDDRYAWHDAASTALGLREDELDEPVPAFLVAQTTGRLREVEPDDVGRTRKPRRWIGLLLAALFAFVLVAPGVDGLLGRPGAGHGDEGLIGAHDEPDAVEPPRPMRADFWLRSFVENPLPVEPLPDEPLPDEPLPDGPPGDDAGAAGTGGAEGEGDR